MSIRIVRAQERYCASHNKTINSVSFEGKYLSTNEGFTQDSTIAFYLYCEKNGFPQYYAVNEDDTAVGWCDIVHRDGTPKNVGYIGVGMRADYRNKGIGTQLMLTAMEAAKDAGFSEIRLDCRLSNRRAIKLYRRLGFRLTALRLRSMKIDGKYVPIVCMSKSNA